MNFFRHVLKVALILGIIAGIFFFSMLLYVSDFGTKSSTSPVLATTEATASPEAPVNAAGQPIEQRTLQWIFGEPQVVPTPEPGATP